MKYEHISSWASGTVGSPIEVKRDNPWFEGWYELPPNRWMSAGGVYSHEYSNSPFAGGFLRTYEFWDQGATSVDDWHTNIRGITGYQTSNQGWLDWAVRAGNFVPGGVYAATLANGSWPQPVTWFKLADDVIVLPVIVTSRIAGAAWGPESAQDYRTRAVALFDFIPFQGSRTSNWPADWNPPSSHPWTKTVAADPTGRFDPPDDIWTQCGIQFQVIRAFKFPQPPAPNPPCSGGSPQFGGYSDVGYNEIRPLVGQSEWSLIYDQLRPIVVSFGYANCSNWYGQYAPSEELLVEVDLVDSVPPRAVVAHELGHVFFGSGHDNDPNNLMHGLVAHQALRSSQCTEARAWARDLSARFRDYNEKIGRIRPENPYTPSYPSWEDPSYISWDNTCCDLGGSKMWTNAGVCLSSGGEILPDGKCTDCCQISSTPPDAAFRPLGDCPAPQLLPADKCDKVCCKLTGPRGTLYKYRSRLACDSTPGAEVAQYSLCGGIN